MSEWIKSSFSGNGGCIEVMHQIDGSVLIRNSERPDEWITDTAAAWRAFVAGVYAGEFLHLSGAPRYVVQNRGAAWTIHDNKGHADHGLYTAEAQAETLCFLLNENFSEASP